MRNANSQPESTELAPELAEALKAWQAPDVALPLDQRVLASYRQHVNRVPFWRRFFTASIPVPLPLVVIQAMLFLIATGAVIAFFQERDNRAVAIVQTQHPAEIIPVPIRQDTPAARAVFARQKPLRLRPAKPRAVIVTLPTSVLIQPTLDIAKDSVAQSAAEPPVIGLATDESLALTTSLAPESRLSFTPALNFKVKVPNPLRFEMPQSNAAEFVFETTLEKSRFFDGRISRTISRAGTWVTKPIDKGVGLYRSLPKPFPTLNSFIAPAKDACLAPFRSAPAPVNVQIN